MPPKKKVKKVVKKTSAQKKAERLTKLEKKPKPVKKPKSQDIMDCPADDQLDDFEDFDDTAYPENDEWLGEDFDPEARAGEDSIEDSTNNLYDEEK